MSAELPEVKNWPASPSELPDEAITARLVYAKRLTATEAIGL